MIARLLDIFARLRREHALGWRLIPVAVAALASVAAMTAVEFVPFLTSADRFVQDAQVARQPYGVKQDDDIVIIAITEDTLKQFPYRSPVDRGLVADLLQSLAARKPRAIGIDLLFDQPSEAAKDERLKRLLRSLDVPLAVSYVDSPAVETKEQLAYLDDFVPRDQRAYANIATDQFDMVRGIYPGGRAQDGRYVMSFSRALADKTGVKTAAAEIPIVWHGSPGHDVKPFKEYAADLYLRVPLPEAWFKDKIVLIGTDITLVDRHRTPVSRLHGSDDATTAGVVIQAHALSQLLHGTEPPLLSWWWNFAVALGFALAGAVIGALSFRLAWRMLAMAALVAALWLLGQNLLFYTGAMIGLIAPSLSSIAAFGVMESLSGSDARRQREFIQGAFSRYISPKLVEQLVRNPERMRLEGERREMTFLFTDVQDFTAMSERLDSRTLARVLNAYLEGITAIVLAHDGMVDKFIGDAVFAIFNAPVDLADHAEKAVKAALAIDKFASDFHEAQTRAGVPFGLTRVGVHTGQAVIGNFGSATRFTYTAQGDAVNTASRLEALNKHFGTRLCVSEATSALCPNIAFRPVASVVLKGKSEAVAVFEPVTAANGAHLARYRAAFAQMQAGAAEALALFAALSQEAPDDPLARLHLARLQAGVRGATVVMTEK